MNYKNIYKEKSPEELLSILDNFENLNYEGKSLLHSWLSESELNNYDSSKLSQLKASIEAEDNQINALFYLKNLGLKAEESINEILIKRTSTAKTVDFTGVLIGVGLMLTLLLAFDNWTLIYENGVDILVLVFAVVFTIIGMLGLMLFSKTLSRFIEFRTFQIKKSDKGLTFEIRHDLKNMKYEVSKADVIIENISNITYLSIMADGEKISILTSNEGRVLQQTLTRLGDLLKE